MILTTREEYEIWLTAPAEVALKLQRPLPDCQSASNFGSDSILMQASACLALFSKRSQRDGSVTSPVQPCPRGISC